MNCDGDVDSDDEESSFQAAPFQVSRKFPPELPPTATQKLADTHETPLSWLYNDPGGDRDDEDSSDQVLPFQVSKRIWVPVAVSEWPTATQKVGLVHETSAR